MKRILLLASVVLVTASSCKVFKGDQKTTLTDELPTISVFNWPFKAQSLLLPNTQIPIKVPGGQEKKFQVTLQRKANGKTVMVILPLDEYTRLEKLREENSAKVWKIGDEVRGYLYTAQPIGEASVWMQRIKDLEKDIAEAYRNYEKYIVWEGGSVEVLGTVTMVDNNMTVIPKGSNFQGTKTVESY